MDTLFLRPVWKNLTAFVKLSNMASKSESDRFVIKFDIRRWKEIMAFIFYTACVIGIVYGLLVYGLPSLV
jgi:hypothetical protein